MEGLIVLPLARAYAEVEKMEMPRAYQKAL